MNTASLQACRPSRRHAEFALRIGLTLAATYFFYRTAMNFRAVLVPHPDTEELFLAHRWNQEPLDRTQQVPASMSIPWPRYPGAVVQGSSIRPGSRSPFLVEDLSVSGSPERIINFYRSAMKQRGWKDLSDSTFGLSEETATGQVASQVGLQQEQFLRNFDGLRSTVLMLGKNDRRILISVEDGSQHWKKKVRLALFPERPMDAVEATINGVPLAGRRGARIYPQLAKTDRFGPDEFTTQILTSTRKPSDFFGELERDLERQGWRRRNPAPLPGGSVQPGSLVGTYTRGTDGTMLVVAPVQGENSSAASVTSIRGKAPALDGFESNSD